MEITIRKLTAELVQDYVHFFDTTPHDDLNDKSKCYCVCWCSEDCSGNYERKYLSSAKKRRKHAIECVKDGSIQGYLAYCGGKVVGWCNANTKAECLRCYSWRRFMGEIPTEEAALHIRIKSIFCFVIAPEMKRMGIAGRLAERICLDAAQEGFDFVEAYPNIEFIDEKEDFMGPAGLYEKGGFTIYAKAGNRLVMRKQLK